LHFFGPHNQALVAAYLVHLRTRHYASSTQDNALRALKCFAVLMPAARQATLYQDLTQTTPADIDAWIAAACQQGLAPGTIVTCRRGMQGFFTFLRDQGALAQSPIQLPRHQILVPARLPRPMAEVVAFFRVIDALEDRTMFLLMLRCGLRVSEVSGLSWPALDLDKRVAPLPTRADSLVQKRRDRRLEAGVVATVGATVVPAIDEFAFRGQ
jgi:site-specific recombinase XerC